MVATVGSISIDLVTNVAKFASGFRSAATTVDRESARMSRSIQSADRAAQSFVRNSVAGIAAGLGTREIGRYADAWTEAGNKIRSAGEVAGREGRSLQELNDIATKTRSGLTETVDLYAKLLRSTAQVAKSEEEVARATEIVNKSFKAGGAAASEQAAGILQLSQALGSGVLQGDELRSIRENAPLLAKAIADEFGTTIAGLKQLGAEGQITSERVFKAILNAQKDIDDAFAQTRATLGENLELLKNATIELIGVLDQNTGATAALSDGLSRLAGEFRNAGEAATAFKETGALDDLLRIFGLSLEEGGALDNIRQFYSEWQANSGRTAEVIKADIAEIEERLEELRANQAAGFFEENTIARDLEELKALQDELKRVEIAALSAANNGGGAIANLVKSATTAMTAATNEGTSGGLPNVARYGQETADNTAEIAETVSEQRTEFGGYFTDLEETLRNDVTGGITKYIQQLIYAQNLAAQTITEAVRTSFLTGQTTSGTGGKTYTSTYRSDITQTVYDPMVHGSPEDFANLGLSRGGLKINYAGMFADGGSFIAPGNQTGDTSRLVMDVNGGERVTVEKAGAPSSITLNFYAAQGETEATMRQRARKAGEEIGRQLARA